MNKLDVLHIVGIVIVFIAAIFPLAIIVFKENKNTVQEEKEKLNAELFKNSIKKE